MDLAILKTEIIDDPLGRGYSGMTDAQIADSLVSVVDQEVDTDEPIPTRKLFERFDVGEYASAITDNTNGSRNSVLLGHLLGMGDIVAGDPNVATVITTVFGNVGSSQTVKNLIGHAQADSKWIGRDLRKKKVSRAIKLLGEYATPSDVARARLLP